MIALLLRNFHRELVRPPIDRDWRESDDIFFFILRGCSNLHCLIATERRFGCALTATENLVVVVVGHANFKMFIWHLSCSHA